MTMLSTIYFLIESKERGVISHWSLSNCNFHTFCVLLTEKKTCNY